MARIFSEEIYNPSFELDGPHLVAASAGTGKTYNIQSVYARLVAEKGLRAGEIQVMTFTEAATAELRRRIRQMLAELAGFYAGTGEVGKDARERLEKLRSCARARIGGDPAQADAVARGRVELALMEFDQAAISTIHGFCHRALRRFAFETGSAFRTEFADDKAADLARRVYDWWRREGSGLPDGLKGAVSPDVVLGHAKALSGKAGWQLTQIANPAPPADFMLDRAAQIVGKYEADRPSRETQTFDDLLRAVRDALLQPELGPHLAELLRGEFKAALVDEFQDTDPVQYEIFRRVFLDQAADAKTPLFLVGDPKQAIYSFRGGDIFTYRAAALSPEVAASTFCLDQNFRSTPRLVAAVNMIFRDGHDGEGRLKHTFGHATIAYDGNLRWSDKIQPLRLPDGSEDPKPFRFIWVNQAKERCDAVVDSVLATLSEQGPENLSPKDIAILALSHPEARSYRAALRAKGVPAVLQKAGNVFAGETANEFRVVLQAMALSGGVAQVRAALMTDFFSCTAEEVKGSAGGQVLADAIGTFGELNRVWVERGFNAAFSALAAHKSCALKQRFAQLPDGERKLADVYQLADLASAAVMDLGPAPETLVAWLTERINLADDGGAEADSEAYARQLESESEAVKIMTVHVSKGLEFPVVVVPLTRGANQTAPYFFHGQQGGFFVSMSGETAAAAQKELADERLRLLYVAFTRASRRTVVIAQRPAAGSPLEALVVNAKLNGAEEADSPIAWGEFDAAAAAARPGYAPPAAEKPVFMAARTPRSFSAAPTRGSYTSLAPGAHGAADDGHDFDSGPATSGAEEAEHPVFKLGAGRRAGVCWHEILEKLPFGASADEILSASERALRAHGLASSDASAFAADVRVVSEMIAKTLAYPLTSPDGTAFSLRDVVGADRLSEWEFDFSTASAADATARIAAVLEDCWRGDPRKQPFLTAMRGWNRPIPKGFLRGFQDLVFRRDGFYYVVDWKSNAIGGRVADFGAEGVTAEMAAHGYFFQYLLYAAVLHRFLKETLGDGYSWARNFGGVRYYFLRGVAAGGGAPVFADRPGEELLDRLCGVLGLEER